MSPANPILGYIVYLSRDKVTMHETFRFTYLEADEVFKEYEFEYSTMIPEGWIINILAVYAAPSVMENKLKILRGALCNIRDFGTPQMEQWIKFNVNYALRSTAPEVE